MYDTIVRLMEQLGVNLPSPSVIDLPREQDFTLSDVDLQVIIKLVDLYRRPTDG